MLNEMAVLPSLMDRALYVTDADFRILEFFLSLFDHSIGMK